MSITAGRCVDPTHNLFRLIWSYAFSADEQCVLKISTGQEPELTREQFNEIVALSVINRWGQAAKSVMALAQKMEVHINCNMILLRAAQEGCISSMREARSMGAMNFDGALGWAAYRGQIEAMREARAMGASDYDNALGNAALGGQIAAMKEAYEMGGVIESSLLNTVIESERPESQRVRALLEAWRNEMNATLEKRCIQP